MDTIRQWVITVSVVSVISGVLMSLLPKSNNKNLFRSIAGVIMIYTFLQPLIGTQSLKINISDYLSDNYSISESIDEYADLSIISSAEKAIENLLTQEAEKLKISCSFTCRCKVENEKIHINSITVKPKPDENSIKKIYEIADSLAIERNAIVFEGENDEY